MKLKENFITYDKGDDHILIDASSGFSGLVHSNKTAAFIVDCLKTDTTEKDILDKMLAKYDGDKKVMAEDIKMIIGKLRGIGALEE